jgi:serine/threonine protein kinase
MAVVTCSNCGTKNRVDGGAVAFGRPVCGKCATVLNETAAESRTSSSRFRKGDIVGPYTLLQQIGRGGFGEVWLAEKKGLVTISFALKLPKDDDIDAAIFKQEAAIWVQASGHPNIIPIVEADVHSVKRDGVVLRSNQIVIVSEYLRDGSLQKRLDETGAMSADAACEIAEGILAGLKFLHTRQPSIVHRDLKPDNVLLQEETPRLTDFGIARMLKTSSYSLTVHISGTYPYMAPEVYKGHYSVRTDVWAAGVILYQLLSNRLPFAQSDLPALISSIANDEPPPLPSSVPAPLRAVVFKALKKNPTERYQSAAEMRQALTEARHGHGNWASTIPAPPPPVPVPRSFPVDDTKPIVPQPQPPKPFPKSVWIIAAVAVLLFIFGLSLYLSSLGPSTSSTAAERSTPSPNNADSPNVSPNVNADRLVAAGHIELETGSEESLAERSGLGAGRITQWRVKPGDVVNPGVYLADLSFATSTYVGHVVVYVPAKVMSITVNDGQEFSASQELCRIARVLHVRVNAKLAPDDLARIPIGSNAFFKTKSKKVFKGRVESVNIQEGTVKIKLSDEHIFDSEGFLTIDPEARGDVTFDQ